MSTDYSDISNYEMIKTLGEGNFGKVKLAIFRPTNEEFAIKIMNKAKIKSKMKNSIFRENEISTKFNHINIVYVYNIIDDIENYYIIMEYCKGGELYDYLLKNKLLNESEASLFFYQIINGVEYIHLKGFSHRDLKLENILLTEGKLLKIIDFGLSHEYDENSLLRTKCGSPSYSSPELIKGDEYDGFKIDIWCCGIILYVMVCGFMPFEGDDDDDNKILYEKILECKPKIPEYLSEDVKELISKMLSSDPKNRIDINEIKKNKFYLQGKELCDLYFDGLLSEYYEKIRQVSGKAAYNRRSRNQCHYVDSNHNTDRKNYFKCSNDVQNINTAGNSTVKHLKKINDIFEHNDTLKKKIGGRLNYSYKFGKISQNLKKSLNINKIKKSENNRKNKQESIENNKNSSALNDLINIKKKANFVINKISLMRLIDPININICEKPNFNSERKPIEDSMNNVRFQKINKMLFDKTKKISVNKNGIFKIINKNDIINPLKKENNENNKTLKNIKKNLVSVEKSTNKTPNKISKLLLSNIIFNTTNIINYNTDRNSVSTDKKKSNRKIYLSTEKKKYKNKHLINEININLSKKSEQNKAKNNNILNSFTSLNNKNNSTIKNYLLIREKNAINSNNNILIDMKTPLVDKVDISTIFRQKFGKIGKIKKLNSNNNNKKDNILPFIHEYKYI